MVMKKLFPLLLLILLCSSCTERYRITGASSVMGLDGKMLFLRLFENGTWTTVDSAEVVHGVFSMKGKVDTVCVVTLFMDESNILPLVLEKGKITISISRNDLRVSGTPYNDKLYGFFDKREQLERKMEELGREEARRIMDGEDLDVIQEQLRSEGEQLNDEINNYVKGFITENYENVLGPSIFIMLCSNFVYPVITPQIEEIINGAPPVFRNHPLVREYMSRARENMAIIQEQAGE